MRMAAGCDRARGVDLCDAFLRVPPPPRPVRPGQVVEELQAHGGRRPLPVGHVVPDICLVQAGREVRRVRPAPHVDQRRVGLAGRFPDEVPRPPLGVRVLRVGGEIGGLGFGRESQLDHLPVALVQADVERERVVVVEEPEPVLEPEPAVAIAGRAPVDDVRVAAAAQPRVLVAVVRRRVRDLVAGVRTGAVVVVWVTEEFERQPRLVGAGRGGRKDHRVRSRLRLAPSVHSAAESAK